MYRKEIIKNLRLMTNKKQKEIADMLNISKAAYSRYENGHREPGLDTISKIAEYYDVDPSIFFINYDLTPISLSSPLSHHCNRLSIRLWELEEMTWYIKEYQNTLSKNELDEYYKGLEKLHNRIEELKKVIYNKITEESFNDYLKLNGL